MSINDKKNIKDQEIDLLVISEKIGVFFQGLSSTIFNSIQFIIRNILILVILLVIGVGLGSYLDKTQKVYDHEVIVQPNFGTTDYLYSKVELLKSKIKEKDTLFFKAIGIKEPSSLLSMQITPVIDIYKFISSGSKDVNEQNFELLKLMAEDGEMKKIVEDKTTSKNYAFHLISFTTNEIINKKNLVEPLLKYINNSIYFNEIRNVYLKNEQNKIIRNNEIIAQIDGFINNYIKKDTASKNDKLIYNNENTQLNDVIQTKNGLISENGRLQLDMVNVNKIIKESSVTINLKNTKSINGKLKLVFPMLLIFLYFSGYFFISFYKNQALKNKQS